jgi:hypothetical protein
MHGTRQSANDAEIRGKNHLTRHPEIRRALQSGLQAIQDRLWRKLAGKNNLLISKEIAMQELYKRVSGPESLLVKVCHGNMRKWLNKNLTPTSKGWLTPDLNGN